MAIGRGVCAVGLKPGLKHGVLARLRVLYTERMKIYRIIDARWNCLCFWARGDYLDRSNPSIGARE